MTPGRHVAFTGRDRIRWSKVLLRCGQFLVVVLFVVITLVPTLLALTGHRQLIVRSGSMQPALNTGDVIVTDLVPPGAVHTGDIVTFADPGRNDLLITHRVVEVTHEDSTYSFVTRGDANTGTEHWAIAEQGQVGRFQLRVPKLGFALASLSNPLVRSTLVALALVCFVGSRVRRNWWPV